MGQTTIPRSRTVEMSGEADEEAVGRYVPCRGRGAKDVAPPEGLVDATQVGREHGPLLGPRRCGIRGTHVPQVGNQP